MPIYEFRCQGCGAQFETLVRAGTVVSCPACAGTSIEKRLSAIAPSGKSAGILASARARAARAGHLSNE